MCVCITFVAVLKANKFLNSLNLSRDWSEGTENRAANYSGMISPEITVLHEKSVRPIYERDVLSNRLEGTYMGIWQFHHAAEAFCHTIGSVYLRKTNQILRIIIIFYFLSYINVAVFCYSVPSLQQLWCHFVQKVNMVWNIMFIQLTSDQLKMQNRMF